MLSTVVAHGPMGKHVQHCRGQVRGLSSHAGGGENRHEGAVGISLAEWHLSPLRSTVVQCLYLASSVSNTRNPLRAAAYPNTPLVSLTRRQAYLSMERRTQDCWLEARATLFLDFKACVAVRRQAETLKHPSTHGDKRVNSHWLPCPKILCMVTKLWPMSQGASHLERSDLKLFEDRGFRVLRVHDVTSSIVDTSCNNLPRYSTRRYVFLPDDIELRWRELCQRTSRPLHKTHSPSVFYTKCPAKPQRLSKTLSLESGCTHTRPSVRGDGPKHAVLPTTGK